jgi:hypothetical protein
MNWFDWLLIVYFLLNAIAAVALFDRPSTPNTPGVTAMVLVVHLLLVGGLLYTHGALG